jgi:hypothetical protein
MEFWPDDLIEEVPDQLGAAFDERVGPHDLIDGLCLIDAAGEDILYAPGERTVDDLIDDLAVVQSRRAQLAAQEADLLVQIAGVSERHRQVVVLDRANDTEKLLTIADEAREEIAAALHRSPAQVHQQLVEARLLFGPLRETRDALAAGEITEAHARVVCEQARRMLRSVRPDDDPERFPKACQLLQQRVLPAARELTPGKTRSLARQVVERIDADRERERRQQARRGADVSVYPEDDGMAVLLARLTEVDALRVGAAIDAHARSGAVAAGCGTTAGERRAAALVDLVCGGGSVVGVEVTVTVPLDEVLDPESSIGALIDDPDVPVTLRRLLTDPQTGCAIDLGRSRYEVSDALRRWIAARDRTCTFPGCSRRARACDIDHITSWDDGGRTDACNLQPLCRRHHHHHLKTFVGWRLVPRGGRADGTDWDWLSPLGRRHPRHAPPVLGPAPPVAEPEPELEPPPF